MPPTSSSFSWAKWLLVPAVIAPLGYWFAHRDHTPVTPRPKAPPPIVVTPLLPPPPPPPPPVTPPPEPEVREEITQEAIPEEPLPPDDTPPAPDEPPADLGTGLTGDGPNNFGLTAGGGTRGGSGKAGTAGRHAGRFDGYARIVQSSLAQHLQSHPATRNLRFSGEIRIWLDPTGRITRIRFLDSGTSDATRASIRQALEPFRFAAAPPADMPMPIRLRLSARSL